MSVDWYGDVLDFHRKFGCAVGSLPAAPGPATAALRGTLIREEVAEALAAIEAGDAVALADGLADAIYVLVGTAITWGIDLRPVWDAVQAANMAKEGGARRDDGKILKPDGWQPPDIAGVLARQEPIKTAKREES